MAEDKSLKKFIVPLVGKWKPRVDPTMLQDGDFQTLTNLRYTESGLGIRSVAGMTKINTTSAKYNGSDAGVIMTAIHYEKSQPAESHILAQVRADESSSANGRVLQNITAVPGAGDFDSTVILTETAANIGCFSEAPDGCVAYTNGNGVYVWSGDKHRVPAFIWFDITLGVNSFDFTDEVNNYLNPTDNVATLDTSKANAMYIGSLRPLTGLYLELGASVNSQAATVVVEYSSTDTTGWSTATVSSDTTVTAGVPLSKSGKLSWTNAEDTPCPAVFQHLYLYWYRVYYTIALTTGIQITRAYIEAPFEAIQDIWDGTPRLAQQAYYGTADVTANISTADFYPGIATSYCDMSAMVPLSSNAYSYLMLGFVERQTALQFILPYGNTNISTLEVSYWNGSAWVALSTSNNLSDGTKYVSGVDVYTLRFTGFVTWNSPPITSEFKTSIYNGGLLYYYRVTVSATLSANVLLDQVTGIPAQISLPNYNLVTTWQNRMVLLAGSEAKGNSILIGSAGTVCVFNGSDTMELSSVGNDRPFISAAPLFTRYTGAFYDTLVLVKSDEVWVLDGLTVADYRLYKVSSIYGCVAARTFHTMPMPYEVATGVYRHIAVWLHSTGVVMFDGNVLTPIDEDIRNYFDPNHTDYITAANLVKSSAFVDEREREYHLNVYAGAGGTATELVYSPKKKGWFKIERGTTLTCGFMVGDTNGQRYCYGGTSTGFLERLENGNTFDGTNLVGTFQTPDKSYPDITRRSTLRKVKLIVRSKSSGGTVTLSHYGDGSNTADIKTITGSTTSSTARIVQIRDSVNWGDNVFHSIKATITTSNAAIPFEPIAIAGFYMEGREDY